MTDTLHYPDMFTTINIPEPEQHIALIAKHLFDVAVNARPGNTGTHRHFTKLTDTAGVSQAFWHHENNTEHTRHSLVLSILGRGMIIALEHSDLDGESITIRRSLSIGGGVSRVYTTDPRNYVRVPMGSESQKDCDMFKDIFFETVVHLGLHRHIMELNGGAQNESRAAIFANAS